MRPIAPWLGIFFVMLSARGHCQEAIRMSLASEQAAEAQNPTVGSNYYNVQAGPVYLRFQGEMGIELNDNVNYTETHRRADVILRPVLNTDLLWPLTERNNLSLISGLGYVDYLRTSTLDHPYVAPNSKVAFKFYSGDFVFELHDRFSAVDNGCHMGPEQIDSFHELRSRHRERPQRSICFFYARLRAVSTAIVIPGEFDGPGGFGVGRRRQGLRPNSSGKQH
jgi:hypothetical protein